MSSVESLRGFVSDRLAAAAEEIFDVFRRTIMEYEEEVSRQRRLLDDVLKPEVQLQRIELPQHFAHKEQGVLSGQQLCNQEINSSLDQEQPEPPRIKDEQEDLCQGGETSQGGEYFELKLKQETESFELFCCSDESDHNEPEQNTDHQLLAHSSASDIQDSSSTKESPKKNHMKSPSQPPEPSEDLLYPDPDQELSDSTILQKNPNISGSPSTLSSLDSYSQILLQISQTSSPQPFTQPHTSKTSWFSSFQVPWEKMPVRLTEAMVSGKLAHPADRRKMIRIIVDEMRIHCLNPNKAACVDVARAIVSQYPATFADMSAYGEQLGNGYYSLLKQIKTRVEFVNRHDDVCRIRQPRRRNTGENSGDIEGVKRGRSERDSYGCVEWQPRDLPEGETVASLEAKRQKMSDVFRSAGPQSIETLEIEEYMKLTYIYQRNMINSWPAPALSEIEEQWPFLFTKRGLCSHFHTLTGIEFDAHMAKAFLSKGKRILSFFQGQRFKWSREIVQLLCKFDRRDLDDDHITIAAILLLMKLFGEQEDSLFLLADASSTAVCVGTAMALPTSPRIIALGQSLLAATRWMITMEGRVFYGPEQLPDFTSTLAVFFGSYYVFNLEYQDSASTTLEMIQRFFVRINPDVGSKCEAKLTVSRKTGCLVRRKVANINPQIITFLQRVNEFEQRNSI